MGVNMTMTLNPNGIGIPGRPGAAGFTPGMAAIGGQPNPGMGIMAMMAAAAPPPPLGILIILKLTVIQNVPQLVSEGL